MSATISAVMRRDRTSAKLDAGVVIERVRVIANAAAGAAATQYESGDMPHRMSAAGVADCRIYIRELAIEAVGGLDHAAAYQLGHEVAHGLVVALCRLQEERLQGVLHSRRRLGPVVIRVLRARLGNLGERTPPAHTICRELVAALEGRLTQ